MGNNSTWKYVHFSVAFKWLITAIQSKAEAICTLPRCCYIKFYKTKFVYLSLKSVAVTIWHYCHFRLPRTRFGHVVITDCTKLNIRCWVAVKPCTIFLPCTQTRRVTPKCRYVCTNFTAPHCTYSSLKSRGFVCSAWRPVTVSLNCSAALLPIIEHFCSSTLRTNSMKIGGVWDTRSTCHRGPVCYHGYGFHTELNAA